MKYLSFSFAVLASLTLTGCLQTRADLRGDTTGTPDRELQRQTRTQQTQQQSGTAVVAPPKPLPTTARLDEMDEHLRQMNGRLEVMENQIAQLNAAIASERGQDSQKVLNDKFSVYEEALKKLQDQVQEMQAQQIAMQPSDKLDAAQGKRAATASAAQSSLHDEGDSLFKGKKWKDAIVTFSKYREQFPKGKKYADSTYKIGVCFQELGMKEEAKPFLEEVVSKFPGTKEAQKASYRLKTVK